MDGAAFKERAVIDSGQIIIRASLPASDRPFTLRRSRIGRPRLSARFSLAVPSRSAPIQSRTSLGRTARGPELRESLAPRRGGARA